ncbi:MAG: glutamate-5-semialdehyde dehydrogenase [bacterium]
MTRLGSTGCGKTRRQAGLPADVVQFLDSIDRTAVPELVKLDRWVDLVIPRGGEALIRFIKEQATVPVLGHGKGLCHVYVDRSADPAMAEEIIFNAKASRPDLCNAMETLLVHVDAAAAVLPRAAERLAKAGVELRGDERARGLVPGMKTANAEDWDTEYLDLILAVRIVDSLEEAIEHVNRHSSGLSETIVTEDKKAAKRFLEQVDSAVVYHNASTRFTDGGEFGFGAEIGIATGRLHARGPMALRELTTTKYLVYGTGQVR